MVGRWQSWIAGICVFLLVTQSTLAVLGETFAPLGTSAEGGASSTAPSKTPPNPSGEVSSELPTPGTVDKTQPQEEPIDPEKYTCGPGDQFQLNFWGQQNSSVQLIIDAQGRAFVPKVGHFKLADLTLVEAFATLQNAIATYYPKLKFELSLIKPRTFLVHVVGAVLKPGIYSARATERLTKALTEAGGQRKEDAQGLGSGSIRRIEISRRGGKKLIADLLLYNTKGDTSNNPYLSDGDVIFVPYESLTATISGAVQRPGRYELVGTKDLAELVDLAGGLHSSATKLLPLSISRRDPNNNDNLAQNRYQFSASNALPAVPLQTEDRVHVPSITELQRSVMLVGAIAGTAQTDEATTLRRMPYEQGDTVRSLIERAGGVAVGADYLNAFISRQSGQEKIIIPVDLEALLVNRDMKADRPVQIGDVVNVPFRRRAVMIEGAVVRPGVYQFNPRLRALDYVAIAGGPGKMAQDEDSYRLVTPQGKTSDVDKNTLVQPGDTLVVPERHFSRAEVTQIILGAISLAIMTTSVAIVASK